MFASGALSTTGVFLPALVEKLAVPIEDLGIMATFNLVVYFIAANFTGKIIDKFGSKFCLALGGLCLAGNFFIIGHANSIWGVYLGSAVGGVANAAIVPAISLILTRWFVKKRNSVISTVFAAAGLGGSAFIALVGQLLSRYSTESAIGKILVVILLVMTIPVAILLIADDPSKKGLKPFGADESTETVEKVAKQGVDDYGVDAKTARKSISFYLLIVGLALSGMSVLTFWTYGADFWQTTGMDALASANYLSVGALMGSAGVFLAGRLAEKFGGRFYVVYTLLAYIIGMVLLLVGGGGTASFGINVAILVLMGLSYPLLNTTPSITTMAAYGRKGYSSLIGNFQSGLAFGQAFTSFVVLAAMKVSDGYNLTFSLMIVLAVVAMVLMLMGLKLSPLNNNQTVSNRK